MVNKKFIKLVLILPAIIVGFVLTFFSKGSNKNSNSFITPVHADTIPILIDNGNQGSQGQGSG